MIECEWQKRNKLLVNFDGQVFPCCYIQNSYVEGYTGGKRSHLQDTALMSEYEKSKDELNIFKNDINSINNHEWFKKLEQSIASKATAIKPCIKHCSIKK